MRVRLQIGALIFAVATALAAGVLLFGGTALGRSGDADCDATVSTVDAALVLYYEAHLQDLPCSQNADVDGDRLVNSKDAALILQIVAGLWFPTVLDSDCPPQGCPTSTPCPPGGCPTRAPRPTATRCPLDGCTWQHTVTPRPTPTPAPVGAEFSLTIDTNGDGTDDCSTRDAVEVTCDLDDGGSFLLSISLDRLPPGLAEYGGFDLVVGYDGATLAAEPSAAAWPDCGFSSVAYLDSGSVALGCAIGVVGNETAPSSSYLGVIATAQFSVSCGGSISLEHGTGKTDIVTIEGEIYVEGHSSADTLRFACP